MFGLKESQDLENWAAHRHQEFPGVTPPGIRSSSLNIRHNIIVCVFVTQVKYKAGTIRESKIFIMKRKLPIGMALLS